MRAVVLAGLGGVAMAGLIAACAPGTQLTTGRSDFRALCVDCHGPAGKGDGPMAEGLNPRPADITRIARDNGGVFPRNRVMSHIYGYSMGRGETAMPSFGDVLEGRTVLYDSGDGVETPTPWRLVALMEYVEGLQE
ncbi:c-type cytochrome [Paracoccus spongiarum]|uniref:Cytochrome c n=1 Tax=Paracoccus spongiarum TaxID=3064387 RepID=A0ABT9J8Y3_9RHOB|nr:cytochrome c [Paracoccus sp. 2205BS29-5]MDP5306090.1 cytochrome c [Paracoccus sp. 2205BS29-5]